MAYAKHFKRASIRFRGVLIAHRASFTTVLLAIFVMV
jgi:hypothetical protein